MTIPKLAIRSSLLTAALLFATGVHAGTIGPTGCANNSCFGGVYSLDAFMSGSTATTETWRVTYSLDLSGYTGAVTDFVRSLAIQVVSASNLLSVANVFNPTTGNWALDSGNVSNVSATSNGCSGSTSNGWICLAYVGQSLVAPQALTVGQNSTFSWVFDATVKSGSWRDLSSIQANFDPPTGRFMSETVRVPEGFAAELPILLIGLTFFLLWQRRNSIPLVK